MLDYNKGFSNLCKMDKNVVQRLKILAGAITVPVGKKWKRMPSLFCVKLRKSGPWEIPECGAELH